MNAFGGYNVRATPYRWGEGGRGENSAGGVGEDWDFDPQTGSVRRNDRPQGKVENRGT